MASMTLGRLVALMLALWLGLLLYISGVLVRVQERPHTDAHEFSADAIAKIERAKRDIDELRLQNTELRKVLLDSSNVAVKALSSKKENAKLSAQNNSAFYPSPSPTEIHELLRRKLENGILELYFYYSSQAKEMKARPNVQQRIDHQFSAVLADAKLLGSVDQADMWRRNQLANLTRLMQRRIYHLQNPKGNCDTARQLVCNLNKGCGFGCQLHHVGYCFIVAYATQRTLLFTGNGQDWRYSAQGWSSVFKPVSDTCQYNQLTASDSKSWSSLENSKDERVVSMPIVDGLSNRPPHLPLAFPKDLADRLLHLHGYPPVWFVGQFVHYLMRPGEPLRQRLNEGEQKVGFSAENPTVGVQVRRTDKVGTEAAFHALEEYMEWVERWFMVQELVRGKSLRRRVLVATDDPAVVKEAREKYTDYAVFGDVDSASSAGLGSRYTDSSLFGVVSDIHLLSKCDYLVCTFSSQVCRVAYELMQVDRGDAASWVHSLDDIYYYGGQQAHEQEAILPHSPVNPGEIELQVGDVLGIAGNHWDGFSKGHNRRTGQSGLYPSYKVKEKWRIVDYPTYPNVTAT